jgi:hypothetical protein
VSSVDGRLALSGSSDGAVRVWMLDCELDDRQPRDWDEGARPHLLGFLTGHTVYASDRSRAPALSHNGIAQARSRRGKPVVSDEDFQRLMFTLGWAGFGWLRPEGVRRELERMVADWHGPVPFPEK